MRTVTWLLGVAYQGQPARWVAFLIAGAILFVLVMVAIGLLLEWTYPYPTALRRVRVKWEPRDLWIGCYWNREPMGPVRIYVCFIPCVVLIFEEKR